MHLDLMRSNDRVFPSVERPLEVRALRVWHCKYKSLSALQEMENLEELAIATFPDSFLEILAPLKKLRYLSIVHMPKVTNLQALAGLSNLESLSLATSPSWDSARKVTVVESLDPLQRLSSLKHLELFGVCPPNKSLADLEKIVSLKTGRFSQYPQKEIDRFYDATRIVNQFNPPPCFAMPLN